LGSLQIGGRADHATFQENSVYLGGRAADGGWWIAEDGRKGQSLNRNWFEKLKAEIKAGEFSWKV